MRIPLFRPLVSEEAITAVTEVLRSGWLGTGPKTAQFEQHFARYVGAPYCVAVNSCTSALGLALKLLNLPAGAEIITTPLTFISTNHAILLAGCKPLFADIQPDTGNLDVASVRDRITERTGAIMLVHYAGYPCDLDEFYSLAQTRQIPIIEDCAHACGATYKAKRIGGHGNFHAFSFHAVKNLAVGDGGALTVRSEQHYLRLKKLRWHGISRDTYQRSAGSAYDWDYDVSEVSSKCQMNDIHAAIALAQLARLDEYNQCRTRIAERYRQQLAGVPGLELLNYRPDRTSSYHLFCILAENRDGLVAKLRQHGVDVSVHYRRNDYYPMYQRCDLPNTERFWRRVLSLPMYVGLTFEQIDYIADLIREGW
jgi:perosamine synthetase